MMKRITRGLCMVLTMASFGGFADHALVKDGKAQSSIYLDKDASQGEKLAAEELSRYFEKISGAKVPVQDKMGKNMLVLGTATSKGIPASVKKALENMKEDEGFALQSENGNLYIVGKTQAGTLFGAYTLLEDKLNVRWLYPGDSGEFIPKSKEITLPDMKSVQSPSFHWRNASQVSAMGAAIPSHIWIARNKMQSPPAWTFRMFTDPEVKTFYESRLADHVAATGGHLTFYQAVPPQKYLKTHPEYFALVDGKRLQNTGHNDTHHCISNENVQQLVADYICDLNQKYGTRLTYLFGAPDSTKNWCECPNCKALDDGDKLDVSRRFHTVAQKIAKKVYEKCPDARLLLWAYANYRSIPKGVSIDPRLTIYFCSHGRCFAHTIDDPSCLRNAEVFSLMKEWLKLNPKMRLYEYANCTPISWTPLEEVLAADLKTFRKIGVSGWKEEISYPDAGYGSVPSFEKDPWHPNHKLRAQWLFWTVAAKLAWNPDLDVNEVIADLESKYYGCAYPAMKKFNDLRRSAWKNTSGCFGYPTGDSRTPKLLQKEGLREDFQKLLDEAKKLAANDKAITERIALDQQFFDLYWVKLNENYRKIQGKTLTAPNFSDPVKIDGNPNDPAWAGACYISDFKTAYTPEKNSLPSELKTSVGILSDSKNLYFLVTAMEPATGKLKAKAQTDKEVWSDDSFEIFIAPPNAANVYYQAIVNTQGVVYDSAQPGNDVKVNLGVQAAAKVEKDRYILEIKIPVEKMEGTFSNGVVWNIHFGRNRSIQDAFPCGNFSIDGEPYHQRSSYRTISIGKPLIANGNFNEIDPKTNGLKAWTLNNAEMVKVSDNKYNVRIKPWGSLSQMLWDWKGPLGQSPKARPIQILFRASGKGKLEVSYTRYHDDWDGGKLKRKFFPTDKGPAVELTDQVQNYTVDYTIKPEEWIALWFFSKEGAVIENVSIILK